MVERYDSTAARHYAAFRPPLHPLILERALRSDESFQFGLDVGCGTGRSAVALAAYCERVIGIDPSAAMLDQAESHPQVTYVAGTIASLTQFPDHAFEIVTFAGSLFYAKTDRLRTELTRACSSRGTVMVYDFDLRLDRVLAELGWELPIEPSRYDHQANLAEWPEFVETRSGSDRIPLVVTEHELAHLLLADSHRVDSARQDFPEGRLFESLVTRLTKFNQPFSLDAEIFFTRYQLVARA